MKITVAEETGFCFGVRRALKTSYDVRNRTISSLPVYTLGELAHNPEVVQNLEKEGIRKIEAGEMEKVPAGILIVRAHGIPPDLRKKAVTLGFDLVDCTCPLVEKIHKIVIELKKQGYKIVIAGKPTHPEVIGIAGEVNNDCVIMNDPEKTDNFCYLPKLGVVAQTTTSRNMFLDISRRLVEKASEIRIFDTICPSTLKRQDSARELAGKADVMLVIGGKNSSNTHHLWKICSEVNPRSYKVEYPEEIDLQWFEGAKEVGITTGASTPDDLIDRVIDLIKRHNDKN